MTQYMHNSYNLSQGLEYDVIDDSSHCNCVVETFLSICETVTYPVVLYIVYTGS